MLNDNLPTDAQILPFYLADGSDDVALIRGRMASVGRPANSILERHDTRHLWQRFKPKLWHWPPVYQAL